MEFFIRIFFLILHFIKNQNYLLFQNSHFLGYFYNCIHYLPYNNFYCILLQVYHHIDGSLKPIVFYLIHFTYSFLIIADNQ